MEIIARRNEHFNICATYINNNGSVIRPKISLIPKGMFKNTDSFDEFLEKNKLMNQIKFLEVEANTIIELETALDYEEQRILNVINTKYEGVVM